MLLALTAIASLSIGYDISLRVWQKDRDDLRWAERALYASIIGIALWIASTWLMAFLHVLVRPAVIGRTAVFAIVAVALRIRAGAFRELANREIDPRAVARFGLPLLPLLLWTIFVLWRSILVPPLSHDAVAYHLPKAALWVQAHGYEPLDDVSFIIGPRPSNYEMLLADAILLDGQDTYTEWLSILFYLLFIVACVAMTHRWWGDEPVMTTGMILLAGGIPVVLLHAGAHKNDVMTAYFMIAGAVAAGRFMVRSELRALAISGIAFAAAAGTKLHGPILAIFLAPFCIRPLLRAQWNARRIAAIALIAVLSFVLLGAAPHYLDRPQSEPAAASSAPAEPFYGDWANLWIGPWVLLTGPFSNSVSIFVPGHGWWFWRRYEIYFSHLGIPFAIAAVLLAFAFLRYRRDGTDDVRRERNFVTLALAAAFVVLLPLHSVPFGIYAATLPRFVLFLVPVVLNWTFAPAIRELARRNWARTTLATVAVLFALHAADNAFNDAFVPVDYVEYARQNPGTRLIPFDPNRPASIVDRIAGPNDVIAIDGATSTWSYPAFGTKLTRRVIFMPPENGNASVPAEAKWLIVDRSFSVIWLDQRFRTLSQSRDFLGRGTPDSEDARAFERVLHDPRYAAVALRPEMLQGVFVRRDTPLGRRLTAPVNR